MDAAVAIGLCINAVVALSGVWASLRNGDKIHSVKHDVQEIKISVDGRLEQLLATTRQAAIAEGATVERVAVADAKEKVLDAAAARAAQP